MYMSVFIFEVPSSYSSLLLYSKMELKMLVIMCNQDVDQIVCWEELAVPFFSYLLHCHILGPEQHKKYIPKEYSHKR